MGFPLKSNSTLDRGVHRMCCSRGLENSKPHQTNALSKSTKDHQTQSIQGRHAHSVGPLRFTPSTTWCTQAVWCHELYHFLHGLHLNHCYLAQLKKYTFVGAANKVIRTQTCKRKGCSQVPVFGESLSGSVHSPHTSHWLLEMHMSYDGKGDSWMLRRETCNSPPASAPRQPRRGNII